MSTSQETLKAKMRARRRKMEDTTLDSDTSDVAPSPRKTDHTWAAAMEEPLHQGQSEEMTEETEEEIEAAKLHKKLRKTRKKTEEQLEKDLAGAADDADVTQQMASAKRKTRQHLKDEASRTEESGTEVDESLSIPQLAEDDGGLAATTSEVGSRPSSLSPRRMRSDGSTSKGDHKVSSALSQSIRARLTEKMRVAKDKGKDEVYDESKATGRKLAHKRDTVRTTRFDDPSMMRKEDVEAMEALEKSLTARHKWKEAVQKTKPSYMPSREEAYDFFTRVWEPDPDQDQKPKTAAPEAAGSVAAAAAAGEETTPKEVAAGAEFQPGTSAEGADEITPAEPKAEEGEAEEPKDGKPEEEQPLLADMDAEEDSWRYYHVSRADYTPHQQRLDDEENVYFYPSILEAPISEKIFEQEEPRYLEEEGFYVGTKPGVPNRNVRKMENRLLKEPGKGEKWFGEDGQLMALPDPLKETPDRPPIWEEMIPELETVYKKAMPSQLDSRYIQPVSGMPAHYQLDVDVNTVSFTHHHLYSREHVLAAKLNQQYQQYMSRTRKRTAEFLTQKLKALKSAAANVENTIAGMQAEKKPPAGLTEQKQRLRDYNKEIRQTRAQRDTELAADRNLLKHIIKTWRDIKSLRQFQHCTNTSVKVQITKEPTNKDADQAQWDADVEEELAELREDVQHEHHEQLEAYRNQLDSWKTQRLHKKEATKRQRRRERHPEDTESLDLSAKDQEVLSEDEIPKPDKPPPVKDAELRERIETKYNEIRRKPGEPNLYLELSSGATVTPNNQCPKGEQQRRSDVNKNKLYVRVLFNDKEVARTPAKPLGIDFTVRFTQIFNIEIMKWPHSIKLEIVESSGLSSTVLSDVYTAVPEAHVCSDNVQLDPVEFSSYERMSHSHEGVGSGVSFSFEADGSNKISLLTTGSLTTGVAWATDEDGNVLVPPSGAQLQQQQSAVKTVDAVAALGVGGMSDMNKLTEWIAESHLDPNDPSNAELMYLLRPVAAGGDASLHMQLPSHYRLEQLQEEFNFATDQDLEECKRFKMITLREKEEPHFRHKQVPAFDKEIPDEVFLEYEKEKEKEDKISKLDEGSHRAAVAQFMQKVREQVIMRFRVAAHQKVLSDIVFEEAVPNISNIIPSLMKIAEPRRPLKPIRKERKKITAQNLQGVDVKVLVNIVRAFDIPVRSEAVQRNAGQGQGQGATGLQREAAARPMGGETLVRPLVEVMFQRNTETTSVADGPNPSWNEELQLPFKAPNNDYSTTNLQTVNDVIYLNLFDEYVVDVVADDRDRGTSIHRRIEKRWLGSLKIPFSTVYFNSRIDGTFRIQKPPVLLGYTQDTGSGKLDTGFEIGMGSGEHTYLTMFITVEPALTPPEAAKEKFDTSEEEKLLLACDTWQLALIKKFPKREYKAMVVNINGKSVFLTRYFKPLKPPEVLINGQESLQATSEAVARYVAMIPSVSDSVVFPGMCDIWSTCDQFLSMLQGDEEEHAVLLTNYFLHLGLDAWLLLGSAVPEGPTAYVISREKERPKDLTVWNASTGEHYSHKDNYCPVQSVGCLVNQNNIWANIQPYEKPSQMSYDLSNTSSWKPFFSKSFPHPGFPSVQPEQMLYVETARSDVIQIQEKIERTLKEKIMDWRPRNVTRWNRYCVSTFRKLLEKLESSRGKGAQQQHSAELEQILGSYKMCGFPINLPYTEMEPIVDSVFATGVHNTETNDVEFALAVHVHPYPHNILSVWVYVASLVRKR